jgi:hypothetical protein
MLTMMVERLVAILGARVKDPIAIYLFDSRARADIREIEHAPLLHDFGKTARLACASTH